MFIQKTKMKKRLRRSRGTSDELIFKTTRTGNIRFHRKGAKSDRPACIKCHLEKKKGVQANYPDKFGNPNKLCGPCSHEAGSHACQNPCRDCKIIGIEKDYLI